MLHQRASRHFLHVALLAATRLAAVAVTATVGSLPGCSQSHSAADDTGKKLAAKAGDESAAVEDGPIDECNVVLDAFFGQTRSYGPAAKEGDKGDHVVLCGRDDKEPGRLVVHVLNDDPRFKAAEPLPPVMYTVDGDDTPRHARVIRDYAERLRVTASEAAAGTPGQTSPSNTARSLTATAPAGGGGTRAVPVKSGSPAAQGSIETGTVGWNLIFNGTLVSLTNFHVVCPTVTCNPGGAVTLAGNAGQVHCRQKIRFVDSPGARTPVNFWDVAMATCNDVSNPAPQFLHCGDIAYPTMLTPGRLDFDEGCHFDGFGTNGCGALKSRGTMAGPVVFGQNTAWFARQLYFEFNTKPEDSGAIIVRDSDRKVVGLHMATMQYNNKTYSVANPLYRAKWARRQPGTVNGNSNTFPKFDPSATESGNCFARGIN